jgi:chromatin remodeling complex protein RSC6
MAIKNSKKSTQPTEVIEEVVEEVLVKQDKPVKKEKKERKESKKDESQQDKDSKKESSDKKEVTKKEKKPKKVVEEPVETVETAETSDDLVDSSDPKKRVPPTKESILASFDEIISMVETEITSIRENNTKTKGVKFLRTLNKRLKTLRNQSSRVIKQRNSSTRKATNNTNSGFLKPVKISNEMAKFTGWNANELKSRVDVTKYICNYIKENNLQNPTDKRQILADNKLSKLLNYDPKKANEPLTYYRIQSYIKPHFLKTEA